MKDYYEEHGEPEQDEGGDDTEDEEESDVAALDTGRSAAEHKIQTRVRQIPKANSGTVDGDPRRLIVWCQVALSARDIKDYKTLGLDPRK
jgi:hypothetical protein